MFRNILLTATVLLSLGAAVSAHATGDDDHILPHDNRPVPFPQGVVVRFPWNNIQGTWRVEQGDYVSYFSFKKVKVKGAHRQLQVRQMDPKTCEDIATGVGTENSSGTRVLAQMTAKKSGNSYRLVLTSIADKKDVPAAHQESVMVLSLGLNNDAGKPDDMFHMEIMKISPQYDQRSCIDEMKK